MGDPGVERVDGPLGEGEERGGHGGQHRLQEQVEHAQRGRHGRELGEAVHHREPHEQPRREQHQVGEEVGRVVLQGEVHHRGPVGQSEDHVEHDAGAEGAGQGADRVPQPAGSQDPAGEPPRHAQEEQGRGHQGDHDVLEHVDRVQVALADVVHGPVGDGPQQGHPAQEAGDLTPGRHRRPLRHLPGPQPGQGQHVQGRRRREDGPHLGVGVVTPGVDPPGRAPGQLGQGRRRRQSHRPLT